MRSRFTGDCGVCRLRELPPDDLSLPAQSFRSYLAGIRPAATSMRGQLDAVEKLWKLLADRPLLAVVKVIVIQRVSKYVG